LNKIKKSWKFQSTCKSKKAPRPPCLRHWHHYIFQN